jgi:branched-chain amino acid transport system substrate-binding protein
MFNRRALRRPLVLIAASSAMLTLIAAGASLPAGATTTPNASSDPGITSSTISVGVVTSLSGGAQSSFGQSVVQGVNAAFKQVNAKGGVNGRKLVATFADDDSTPTGALTATQSLISKGAFGILDAGALFQGAYRYAVQKGIPVSGDGLGPEYGSKSNYNLFDVTGSPAVNYPAFTSYGKFLKKYGVTKLGVVGAADTAVSQDQANALSASAKHYGIPTVVKDFNQQLGGTDYTATALAMKNAGVNGVALYQVTSSDVAVITALKQQGVKLKAEYISAGYSQAILDDPATESALQGVMLNSSQQPSDLNTSATKNFMSALAKYANYHEANPQEGQVFGWMTAETFIKGMQVAGKNPTWGSFIQNLRKVPNWTINGLLGGPVNFAKFNYYDSTVGANCWYQSVVKGDAFYPLTTTPFCGQQIPNTNTVGS